MVAARKRAAPYIKRILEFAGPVWCPVLQFERNQLEYIQRRMTRFTFGRVCPPYEERLRIIGLTSFAER